MTSLSKLGLAACIGAAAFAGSLFAATADAPWPSRPVRIIVAQAPGGPPDLIGRYVAEKLSRNLGAQVIVDNRPGAGESRYFLRSGTAIRKVRGSPRCPRTRRGTTRGCSRRC